MITANMNTKASNRQLFVILFGISISAGYYSWTSSVSQTLVEVFNTIPVTVVRSALTAYTITAVIASLITGSLIGSKVSYHASAVFGLVSIIVGGTIPFFFHENFIMIWIGYLLTGFGACATSISAPLLTFRSSSATQTKWFGYANVIACIFSITLQNLAGRLATHKWYYVYLVDLIVIIPLLITILFLKEPEYTDRKEFTRRKTSGRHLHRRVYKYVLLLMMSHIPLYTIRTMISTLVSTKGFGSIDTASTVSSLFTFGALIMSLLIGNLLKKTRRWTFTIGLGIAGIGLICVVAAPSVYILAFGCFLTGAAYAPLTFSLNTFTSDITDVESRSLAMILVSLGSTFASFVIPFWVSITGRIAYLILPTLGSDVEGSCIISIVMYIALIILTVIKNPSVPMRTDTSASV